MVGIEGITSITIINPSFAGAYNLGPKFSYINHRHGDREDSSYHGDHNSLDNQTKKYNDRGLYARYDEAVEALKDCRANYSSPLKDCEANYSSPINLNLACFKIF